MPTYCYEKICKDIRECLWQYKSYYIRGSVGRNNVTCKDSIICGCGG